MRSRTLRWRGRSEQLMAKGMVRKKETKKPKKKKEK
jgi:hypothetical protein